MGRITLDPYAGRLLAVEAQAKAAGMLPSAAIAQTLPRSATMGNQITTLSGRLHGALINLPPGRPVSGITFFTSSTGVGTPTAQWFALYKLTRELCRQTVDDGSTPWAANTKKPLLLTTQYTPDDANDGWHYIMFAVVCGTPPTMLGIAQSSVVTSEPPIQAGSSNTGLTTTAPATMNALTALSAVPWGWAF